MKEVLTKKFWQDVKKTFDEARHDVPAGGGVPERPALTGIEQPEAGQPATPAPEQPRSSSEDSNEAL